MTPQLLGASNVFTGSNTFSGAVKATNGNNAFTGTFTGNGAGLSNVAAASVNAGNVSGVLTSGQLPSDVVYLAQLLATNAALRAQAAADLASASNGLSGRLLDTNSALVQLVANEGLLRNNALAAQLAQLLTTSNALNTSIGAVTPQLLGASNVFTGSNTFSGAVKATKIGRAHV